MANEPQGPQPPINPHPPPSDPGTPPTGPAPNPPVPAAAEAPLPSTLVSAIREVVRLRQLQAESTDLIDLQRERIAELERQLAKRG